MRCLHIVEEIDFEKGGVARAVVDLVASLVSHGVETILASPVLKDAGSLSALQSERLRIIELNPELSRDNNVSNLIATSDVVHLHTPWWPMNVAYASASHRLNKTTVFSSHGMLDDWSLKQKRFKKWLYLKFVANKMIRRSILHCTADGELNQVLKHVSPRSSRVIPLVLDRTYFEAALDRQPAEIKWPFLRSKEQFRLVFLSRIHPKKGLELLIDALAMLPDCTLVVAGTGEMSYVESLKRRAKVLNVDSRIDWLGMVGGIEKDSLLACCDCMVLPTQQENFGLAQVEALGCGLELITTYGTDNWPELRSCGAMIIERSTTAIQRAVTEVKNRNTPVHERLAKQRASLKVWIDPSKTTQQYIDLYSQSMDRAGDCAGTR